MTPERAKEILKNARFAEYSTQCTKEEREFVNKVWGFMGGHTCFYDALVRIARDELPGTNESSLAEYKGYFETMIEDGMTPATYKEWSTFDKN